MVDNRLNFQEISQLVEDQFPAIYREEGPVMVAFLKAYYEWMETSEKSAYNEGRQLIKIADLDTTLDDFLDHFKSTYLDGFPYSSEVDTRFLIKHVMDFYRTKGTKQSTELFMKLLFGQEIEIYYPGEDVLKPSDSTWKKPQYLEVSTSNRTKTFIDKKIFGASSGASGFVDSVVRKRINGKMIDIIYMSTVQGTFITGDAITDDGEVQDAPTVVGSLSYFDISSGGRNNKIGDLFDVVAVGGTQGKVRVVRTQDATGRVDFSLLDGGNGYTNDDNTKVYVSNTVLITENANLSFIDMETVYQPLEKIDVLAAAGFNATGVPGDLVKGVDSSNVVIAEGTLISISNPSSANAAVVVMPTLGTFLDQVKITANSTPTLMTVGEYIDEEASAVITISANSATVSVGHLVEQYSYSPIDPTLVVNYSFATVASITGSELTVNGYFGKIVPGLSKINGANATISAVSVTVTPASARIANITGTQISLGDVSGVFDAGKKFRSRRTRVLRTAASVTSQGASDIRLHKNGNTAVVDTTDDMTVRGMVVGQGTTDVGVYGSPSYVVSNTFPTYIYTDRSMLLSPPRDANNNVIDLQFAVTAKSTGSGANFAVASLINEQTVTINSDTLNGQNIGGVNYLDIRLDGYNSGINRIDSFVVNTAGSGYANGGIVNLTGGGYGNSSPFIAGQGTITTNGSGGIATVVVTNIGSGYYQNPTVVLPATGGTTANVSVVLDLQYGFPKSFAANANSVLIDALSFETMTIGTISSLKKVNPGVNYNRSPYVRVFNKSIAAHKRGDYIIVCTSVIGSFQPGETIYQQVAGEIFEKGIVQSYDADHNVIEVDRTLFDTSFTSGYPIIGMTTASQGTISNVVPLNVDIFGDNEDISGKVIAANGVITEVEVIDSGYGYEIGSGELVSETNPFTVSGSIRLGKHGVGEGFWTTTNSHLNSEKKLHDNDYYQEFSYDIISSMPLSRYADVLKAVTHPTGMKMFGSIANVSVHRLDLEGDMEITILSI
jgi:hypothetical protein